MLRQIFEFGQTRRRHAHAACNKTSSLSKSVLMSLLCSVIVLSTTSAHAAGGDPYEAAVMGLNPLLYWRLDEPAGPTAENLGSLGAAGDGEYGSVVDHAFPPLPPCSGGTSIKLSKLVESRVLLDPFAMPTSDLSISFWVQGEDVGLSHFFAYGTLAQTNEFTFGSDNGEFRAIVQGNINDYGGVDVLDGLRHHIGVSRNGTSGEVRIYVDGQLVITDTFSTAPMEPMGAIAVGQDFDSPTPPYGFDASQAFDGQVDEVCIFDRELTAEEMVVLAQGDPYENFVISLAPELYWTFDESSGATTTVNKGTQGDAADGLYGSEAILEQDGLVGGPCAQAANFIKDVDSHVLLPSFDIPINDISFSFWVQGEDNGISTFLGSAVDLVGFTNEYTFGSNEGSLRIIVQAEIVDFPGIDVLDGTPHHLTIVREQISGDVSVYVDGRRVVFDTMSYPSWESQPGPFAIAQDFDDFDPPYGFDPAQAFEGTVDDVAVFGRLLTPEEIVPLADQGLLGDVNCDGDVNLLDVDPFINAVAGGGYSVKADANGDGEVNLLDVAGFIDLLAG